MSQIGQYPNAFYRVSVKAVIRNDRGEVLLVKENNNEAWNLPGGGMDHGESEYDCLTRELYEEVGYKGTFSLSPIGIQPMYILTKDACQLWVVFELHTENMNFAPGPEAHEICWKDPHEFHDATERPYNFIYKFCVDPSRQLKFQ